MTVLSRGSSLIETDETRLLRDGKDRKVIYFWFFAPSFIKYRSACNVLAADAFEMRDFTSVYESFALFYCELIYIRNNFFITNIKKH
jgi:hypothetical protein